MHTDQIASEDRRVPAPTPADYDPSDPDTWEASVDGWAYKHGAQ